MLAPAVDAGSVPKRSERRRFYGELKEKTKGRCETRFWLGFLPKKRVEMGSPAQVWVLFFLNCFPFLFRTVKTFHIPSKKLVFS